MKTRCKFRCDSVAKRKGWSDKVPFVYDVELNPVRPPQGQPEHENAKFWEASPSGQFKLGSIKDHNFEVGKEYYIDISEAP